MKLVAAADHGGVDLKDELVRRLTDIGHQVIDLGTHGPGSVDYPDFARRAAEMVVSGEAERGVLVCGTGIGMSIAANKIRGIYCAKINSAEEGALASEHNRANMISLGGCTIDAETAWSAVLAWLETQHGDERHQRRVGKVRDMEG